MLKQNSVELMSSLYEALRSEINQRLDLRQQIVTFTVIVAGSFFGIGLGSWVSGLAILCYPALAWFLAGAWVQHDRRIGQIAKYLREVEDCYLGQDGWESYRRRTFQKHNRIGHRLVELPTRGIFATTQMLAVVIGVVRMFPLPTTQPGMLALFVLLVAVDGVAISATVWTLRHQRERHAS